MTMPEFLYRLCANEEWVAYQAAGHLLPNADDRRDGFLHLSTEQQVADTARKYYQDVPQLTLLVISAAAVEDIVKWEPSRGGLLFPHAYGPVPVSAVTVARLIPKKANQHQFPKEVFGGLAL